MAKSVRRRAKQHIPGGGFDANGSPKQGKCQIWGKIVITNYNRAGESLTPADLGLRTIEYIDLKFESAVGGSGGGQEREAFWDGTTQEFYLLEGREPLAATADPVLLFTACGDDQADVELL